MFDFSPFTPFLQQAKEIEGVSPENSFLKLKLLRWEVGFTLTAPSTSHKHIRSPLLFHL